MQEGAFDEYVKDVIAIEHTASPFTSQIDDPQEVLAPAVAGTTSILKSAIQHGKNVQRVVVTSSTAAILEIPKEPKVLNETNWNNQAVKETEEKGREADSGSKYQASKVLAERAAWKIVEENKEKIGWELVTLNPPYVFGPPLQEINGTANLNESLKLWRDIVLLGTQDNETNASSGFVFRSYVHTPNADPYVDA